MEGLYSDEESAPDAVEETEAEADPDAVEPHSELVSKKLLMGKAVKPGDRVVLEVVKDYGDEVELRYASEEEEESPPLETGGLDDDEQLAQLAE